MAILTFNLPGNNMENIEIINKQKKQELLKEAIENQALLICCADFENPAISNEESRLLEMARLFELAKLNDEDFLSKSQRLREETKSIREVIHPDLLDVLSISIRG